MAEAKKFDPVTIIGLVLAVALFMGGNFYMRSKQEQREREFAAAQAKQDEERKRAEAANPKPPELTNADPKPPNGNGEKPVPVAVQAEAEIALAPDLTVTTDELTLTFTAEGASLRKASLNNAYVDAAKKDQKGLEILTEIELKRLSLEIPKFEIGTNDPAKQSERVNFESADGPQRSLSRRVWKLESDSGSFDPQGVRTVIYSLALPQKYTITKTFSVHKERYDVGLDIAVANNSDAPISWFYTLLGPSGILLDGPPESPKTSAAVAIRAKLAARDAPVGSQQPQGPDVTTVDPATAVKANEKSYVSREENLWGAVKNRFYTAMLVSLSPTQLNKISAIEIKHRPDDKDKRLAEPNMGILGQRKLSEALDAGKTSAPERYALYLGPTNEKQLEDAELVLKPPTPLYLADVVQYCDIGDWRWPRVDWIAGRLMFVFHHLTRLFGNYGVAVILLTILIKLCLHPTQRKATISMNKMQKLQPEIKKLQDKYKGQTSNEAKMRLYQEQQDLFKKAGASPAGGCLPMLIQIPILSALYGIFSHAFEIRGAQFLWIQDLSQPDHLAILPFWPHELNLLPLIYLGLQLLQMKVAPQAPKSDDPQQEMNRKMMGYMPIVFTFMFYTMPSGLMIYFATSAIFSIIEAWYIRKFLIKDPPSGTPPPLAVPA